MIYCPECNSINVKVLDMDFASRKPEGEPSAKAEQSKKQFHCWTCGHGWFSDPEGEQLYMEYISLKNETTMAAHDMGRGGTYTAQYIDPDKLMRRSEIAKTLIKSYKSKLDIGPSEWYEVEHDAL